MTAPTQYWFRKGPTGLLILVNTESRIEHRFLSLEEMDKWIAAQGGLIQVIGQDNPGGQ